MSDEKYKVGVGIITCDRPEYLYNLLNSIRPSCAVDEFVIINDGGNI